MLEATAAPPAAAAVAVAAAAAAAHREGEDSRQWRLQLLKTYNNQKRRSDRT
jgi:hypothetical protein